MNFLIQSYGWNKVPVLMKDPNFINNLYKVIDKKEINSCLCLIDFLYKKSNKTITSPSQNNNTVTDNEQESKE